jgi:hypothetical protein
LVGRVGRCEVGGSPIETLVARRKLVSSVATSPPARWLGGVAVADDELRRLESEVTSAVDKAFDDVLPWTDQPPAVIRGQVEHARADAKRNVVALIRRRWPKDRP